MTDQSQPAQIRPLFTAWWSATLSGKPTNPYAVLAAWELIETELARLRADLEQCRRERDNLRAVAQAARDFSKMVWTDGNAEEYDKLHDALEQTLAALDPEPSSARGEQEQEP